MRALGILGAGRAVIDAMNRWEPVDGRLPDFADTTLTSREVIQAFQPSTTIFSDRLTADGLRAELTRFADTRANSAHKEEAAWR